MSIADITALSDAIFWMALITGFLGGFLGMFTVGFILDFCRSREAE